MTPDDRISTPVDRLRAAAAASPGDAAAIAARFWEGIARTPLIQEIPGRPDLRRVTFLWRDADAEVVLLSINRITEDMHESRMARVPGTDVWHRTFDLETDWRGGYLTLPLDVAGEEELHSHEPRWAMRAVRERGLLDPRNPVVVGTHGGSASVAELPAAGARPLTIATGSPRGETVAHRAPNGRRVWIRRPPGDDGATERPVVVVLDGEVWERTGYAAEALDELAAEGRIRIPYLVMPDAEGYPRRMEDLSVDGTMSTEIVDTLLPWARTIVPLSADPAEVMVSGESLGGLTALKTAFDHPDRVGLALSQSASLWQHDMRERAAASAPVRLFLTAGRHEGILVERNRDLVGDLADLPHEHRYVEYNGGHDMAWWRGLWADGVRHLLAR